MYLGWPGIHILTTKITPSGSQVAGTDLFTSTFLFVVHGREAWQEYLSHVAILFAFHFRLLRSSYSNSRVFLHEYWLLYVMLYSTCCHSYFIAIKLSTIPCSLCCPLCTPSVSSV